MHAWQRLVLAVLALFIASPAFATTEEFHVIAAGVDDLSTKANEKAFDYAKKRAVFLAIEKMGVAEPSVAAAKITPEQMQQIVRGATILNTKRTENITYQEVLVTIVDEPLRNVLNLPSLESANAAVGRLRPILVLPVLVGHDRPYLWENENTFRPVLGDAILTVSHGAVMVAAGDFGDLRLIDYQNALKVKSDELKPMFDRYGAQEIIIAILTPGAPRTETPSNVVLRRLTPIGESTELMDIPPKGATDTAEQRLQDVAQTVAAAITQIAASTAVNDQKAIEKANHMDVSFLYANPRELTEMQANIRTIPGVMQLEIPAISLKDMTGKIYYTGDKEKLITSITKQGIRTRDVGGVLQLSIR